MVIKTHSSKIISFSSIQKLSRQSLFLNAYALVSSNLITAFSGYLFWMVVARRFDVEIVGLASAIISSMALIELLTNLGLGAGLIRFLTDCKNEIERKQIVNISITVRLGTVLVAGFLFILGINLWAPGLLILQSKPILWTTFIILLISNGIFTLLTSFFVAIRKSQYVFLMSLIYNALKILLAFFCSISFGILSVMIAFLLPIAFSIFVAAFTFLFRLKPRYIPRFSFKFRHYCEFFSYSVSNQIADILITFPQMLMPLLVLNILGPQANAHYYTASMTAGILRTISMSISQSAFAEGAAKSDVFFKHIRDSFWLSLLAVSTMGSLTFVLAPKIIYFFGHSYVQQGVVTLRLLLVSVFPFILIHHLFTTVYRVQKNINLLVLTSLAWSVLSIIGALVGIQKGELVGAVIGWLVGQFVAAVLYAIGYLYDQYNHKPA